MHAWTQRLSKQAGLDGSIVYLIGLYQKIEILLASIAGPGKG